jgi:uncharacterized protein YjbJ (UPF0337 family)
MDRNRVRGAAHQVKGTIKQAIGQATGDTKLEVEGTAEKIAGKVQSSIGRAKDALRNAVRR